MGGALVAVLVVAEIVGGGSGSKPLRAAPALPPKVLSGGPASLRSLRGKPALVNFWASWCEPCKKEAPELARLSRELQGRASLVGVDYTDNAKDALAFARGHGWSYPILSDPDGVYGDRYAFPGLPSTYVLDARGRIRETLTGPHTTAEFRAALARAG